MMQAKASKKNFSTKNIQETKTIKVMIFGTFDMVHKGHRDLFRQARGLVNTLKVKEGVKIKPFLLVSIARDSNVKRIKGKAPANSQTQRANMANSDPLVDMVVLGAAGDHMPHIIKANPDIIALGYDQTAYVTGLRASLKSAGLKTRVVRLLPHKPHVYKTSILTKKKITN